MDSDVRNWLVGVLKKELESFDEELDAEEEDDEEEDRLQMLRDIIGSIESNYTKFTREAYEDILFHVWQYWVGLSQQLEDYEQRIYYADLVEVTCDTCHNGFYVTRQEADFDTQADHAHPWMCGRCQRKQDM